ncbi:MAG TPA: NAD(P)/FAD-dependent oxidoreductase [Gaiellaceae bacterium]|nr:NAD(P)/FAD-dependent oxidoreductase [Gaiellaceae bacterium]
MRTEYDVIVVGTRCAGSPTAMLLARNGYRVLAVDRATFPSDTISTHHIHAPGVDALRRWGLLDRVIATGAPPIETYVVDFGAFTIVGKPGTAYAPRRTVLDKLLVDAASEAGAEIREAFTVESLLFEEGRVVGIRGHERGGKTVSERARVVVGADGRFSFVADAVGAEEYDTKPKLLASYYSYWSDLPMDGRFANWVRSHRGMAAWPTNDGLTLVIAGWPYREFEANRTDVERHFFETLDTAPELAERVRAAKREERFVGAAVPGYFRRPYGRGWVLVGDAGYNKDYITAQGISDAFWDAESCADALHQAFSGARPFEEAMEAWRVARDARAKAMYELTSDFASLEPPPPDLQHVLAAAARSEEAMDGFARVLAGVTSPADFFSDESVGRILAAA